jgi:hypothetical protein
METKTDIATKSADQEAMEAIQEQIKAITRCGKLTSFFELSGRKEKGS